METKKYISQLVRNGKVYHVIVHESNDERNNKRIITRNYEIYDGLINDSVKIGNYEITIEICDAISRIVMYCAPIIHNNGLYAALCAAVQQQCDAELRVMYDTYTILTLQASSLHDQYQ